VPINTSGNDFTAVIEDFDRPFLISTYQTAVTFDTALRIALIFRLALSSAIWHLRFKGLKQRKKLKRKLHQKNAISEVWFSSTAQIKQVLAMYRKK
jgi:hypothetical protein